MYCMYVCIVCTLHIHTYVRTYVCMYNTHVLMYVCTLAKGPLHRASISLVTIITVTTPTFLNAFSSRAILCLKRDTVEGRE